MNYKKFEFNGKSTEDFGLVIQTSPEYTYPARDVTSTHIPGRSGDVHTDNGSYKNVTRTYSLAKMFRYNEQNLYTNAEQVIAWLHSAKGSYARLTDDFDKNVFRKAAFYSNGSISNLYDEGMAFNVTFDCKPQRYLLSGELPVEIALTDYSNERENGKTGKIENIYYFDALPSITLNNIDESLADLNRVVMLTIKNQDEIISSITLNKLGDSRRVVGNLTIDSENESVTDSAGANASVIVGLNGKNFPVLKGGDNIITLNKYSIDVYSSTSTDPGHNIPTYNSMLTEAQDIIKTEYRPYDTLIELEQNKYVIKSWEKLIESKQSKYPAPSLQAHVEESAKKYTFGSVNDLIDGRSEMYSFIADWEDIPGNVFTKTINQISYDTKQPIRWLYLCKKQNSTDNNIYIFVSDDQDANYKTNGYYIFKDNDKKMKYKNALASLGKASSGKTNTIYKYPTKMETIGNNTVPRLDIAYDGKPLWVDFVIIYESSGDYSPISIEFRVASEGYYWRDKSSTFDKAAWRKYSAGEIGTVLNKLDWSNGKLAFTKPEGILGLSSNTNTQLTYMYCSEVPAYGDIIEKVTDEDGETHNVTKSVCTFKVTTNDNLSVVRLYATRYGYYKVDFGDEEGSWTDFKVPYDNDPGHVGSDICTIPSGTTTFTVYYLKSSNSDETQPGLPNYSEEENWPEWLNPVPVLPETGNKLSPTWIAYQVLKDSHYRHTSKTDPETLPDTFTLLHAGDIIGDVDGTVGQGETSPFTNEGDVKAYKVSYTVCELKDMPTERPFDRVYLDGEDNEMDLSEIDWLSVKYYKDKLMQEEIVNDDAYRALSKSERGKLYVRIMAGSNISANGEYYKWDNNSNWLRKDVNEDLLLTGIKDTTLLYHIDILPSYGNFELFDITPSTDASGNPDLVTFTIKVDGYYRANNKSDWTYFRGPHDGKPGDVIIKSKVGESNTIRYLLPTTNDNTLDGVSITIIPRWWML